MMAFEALPPECDETHWPLAILVAEAGLDSNGVSSGLDAVERWLAYEKPFALLLIATCGSVFQGDVARLGLAVQRIDAARGVLHRLLLGVAVVVPTAMADITRQGLARLPLDIPLEIFDKSPCAAAWLCKSILAPAGLVIDSL